MSEHDIVSSEADEPQHDPLHEEVSSELVGPGIAGEAIGATEEFVAEDFLGEGGAGELEAVPGFDPVRALSEGLIGETVVVTESDEAIPSCCAREFEDMMETVCGRDDRVRISPATQVPWRWNCLMTAEMLALFPINANFERDRT